MFSHYSFSEMVFHLTQLDFEGKSIALPFNLSILDWATKTRQLLDGAQLLEGVSFYNIYGTSFDTPFDVW